MTALREAVASNRAGVIVMLDESKRQRAMRPEVRISRQALGIVQPINRQIGAWQSHAARLIALGRRRHVKGGSAEGLRAATEELSARVKAEENMLRAQMRELPAAVANSSRISDTSRALHSISRGLDEALSLFPVETGRTSGPHP
jgi:hypothetical protein